LWINSSDKALVGLVVAGVIAGMLAIIGGAVSGWCLFVCWICFLSLDIALGLAYPWDSLLLEAGFLALFLPVVPTLPTVATSTLPLPIVAFAFHFLIFRLMFGFGKYKFINTNFKERLYLKSFLVNQPIPNLLGFWASKLPNWIFVASLGYLFFVEIISPFLIFFGGDLRIIAALSIIGLMIGIQAMGNFGFFNLLVICLCLTLFDSGTSLLDQSLGAIFSSAESVFIHTVVTALIVGGLFYLPLNSWVSRSIMFWPSINKITFKWFTGIVRTFRTIAPFRVLHSYGIFPPTSAPDGRWTVIIEGSYDGQTWERYKFRFLPSDPSSVPKFIAPHHPRLDHSIFYQGFGIDVSNFFESLLSIGNPYHFARGSDLESLAQRLIEGNSPVVNLFANNPFPDAPPLQIRIQTYMLTPLSLQEQRSTGNWWRMEFVGPHLPPVTRTAQTIADLYPDPELFHWDQIIWRERSPRLQKMLKQARIGQSVTQVLLQTSRDLTSTDVDHFWNDFVPCISSVEPDNWSALPGLVATLKQRYSRETLHQFELIFTRLSLILWARVEPHFVGTFTHKMKIESYFHLGLLFGYLIGKGQITFESVFTQPETITPYAASMTTPQGLFYTALFWQDKLAFHARKFRLIAAFGGSLYAKGLPGFAEAVPFLKTQFLLPDEHVPTFIRRIQNGEWLRVEMPPDQPESL